jgi:protease-4
VDQLGGLQAAIESAATRAKLEKGYRVWYVAKEKSFRERVLEMLTAGVQAVVGGAGLAAEDSPASPFSVAASLRQLQRDVAEVARFNDPRGIYAHCLCGEE